MTPESVAKDGSRAKRLAYRADVDGMRAVAVMETDGHPLYFDNNHLSTRGAKFAAASLEPIVVSIASSAQ